MSFEQILQTLAGVIIIVDGLCHCECIHKFGRCLAGISPIQQSSNLGAILVLTMDHIHQRQSVSLPVIRPFISRSGQDQMKSNGISHSTFPFILVKFLFALFKNSNFLQGVFGPAIGLDTGVTSRHWSELSTLHIFCLFCGFSCCLRATLPHSNSRKSVVASRQHSDFIPSPAVASRQWSWSTLDLSFILFVGLVNWSFPGVPSDTLEHSSL